MSEAEGAGATVPAPVPMDFHIVWKDLGLEASDYFFVTGSHVEDGMLKLIMPSGKGVLINVDEIRLVGFEKS